VQGPQRLAGFAQRRPALLTRTFTVDYRIWFKEKLLSGGAGLPRCEFALLYSTPARPH
jgi:hypothetical protein